MKPWSFLAAPELFSTRVPQSWASLCTAKPCSVMALPNSRNILHVTLFNLTGQSEDFGQDAIADLFDKPLLNDALSCSED